MRITFKLFATLQDYLPPAARSSNALQLEVAEHTSVEQLIAQFGLPQQLCKLVLVDGIYVPPAERANSMLGNGATVAIWPPIAGG